MSLALIVAVILNGQIVYNYYPMNSIDECRVYRTVILPERNVVEAHCVGVISEIKKAKPETKE